MYCVHGGPVFTSSCLAVASERKPAEGWGWLRYYGDAGDKATQFQHPPAVGRSMCSSDGWHRAPCLAAYWEFRTKQVSKVIRQKAASLRLVTLLGGECALVRWRRLQGRKTSRQRPCQEVSYNGRAPPKVPLSVGIWTPCKHVVSTRVCPKTASWSVHPFLHSSPVSPTHWQAHRPRTDGMCSNKPHDAMWLITSNIIQLLVTVNV